MHVRVCGGARVHMSQVWKPEGELGTGPLFSLCLSRVSGLLMRMSGCQDGILGTLRSLLLIAVLRLLKPTLVLGI